MASRRKIKKAKKRALEAALKSQSQGTGTDAQDQLIVDEVVSAVDDLKGVAQEVQKTVDDLKKETSEQASISVNGSEPSIPKRRNVLARGANKILNKVSRARELLFGSKVATEVDKQLRTQYQKIVQQAIITQEIIKDNSTLLIEKSKGDKEIAKLLYEIQNNSELKEIFDKLTKGQELYGRELVQATEFMQRISGTFEKSGLALELNLSQAVGSLTKFIDDANQDVLTRRSAFEDLQGTVKGLGLKTEAITNLVKVESEKLNFTEEQTKQVQTLISALKAEMESGAIKDVKLTGTVRDLNKTLGSVVLTNSELEEFLEAKNDGKSNMERIQGGLGALEGGASRGIISSLFAAAGLPGFDTIFQDLIGVGADLVTGFKGIKDIFGGAKGLIGKVIGKGAGAAATGAGSILGAAANAGAPILTTAGEVAGGAAGAGGLLKGAAKGAGGLLKGGAKLIGKAALPIAAALSLYDFFQGFSNADKIAGIEDGKTATTFQKVQAGISSVVSGLTFGLVSAEDAFKGIDTGIDAMFGEKGFFTEMGGKIKSIVVDIASKFNFEDIKNGLLKAFDAVFGEQGWLSGAKVIVDKIGEFLEYTPIGLIIKGAKMLFGNSMTQGLSMGGVTASGMTMPVPSQVNTGAYSTAMKQDQDSRNYQRTVAENTGKSQVVVVPQQQQSSNSRGPSRVTGIDDLGLSVLNSSMLDK